MNASVRAPAIVRSASRSAISAVAVRRGRSAGSLTTRSPVPSGPEPSRRSAVDARPRGRRRRGGGGVARAGSRGAVGTARPQMSSGSGGPRSSGARARSGSGRSVAHGSSSDARDRRDAGQLGRLPQHERLAAGGGGVGGHGRHLGRVDADQPGRAHRGVGGRRGGQQERRASRRRTRRADAAAAGPARRARRTRRGRRGTRRATTNCSDPSSRAQRRCCGSSAKCRKSGLVSTTSAYSCTQRRSSSEVSPSQVATRVSCVRDGDEQPVERDELVGGEGLGRAEVEGRGAPGQRLDAAGVERRAGRRGADAGERGQPERERLARAGGGGQDGVPAGPGGVGRRRPGASTGAPRRAPGSPRTRSASAHGGPVGLGARRARAGAARGSSGRRVGPRRAARRAARRFPPPGHPRTGRRRRTAALAGSEAWRPAST